jgi:hypothetical protein
MTFAFTHRAKAVFASRRANDQASGNRADGCIDLARIGISRQRATQTIVDNAKANDAASLFLWTAAVGQHDVGLVL